MSATITTSVVTGGSNSHATVAEEANAYATDFVSQGCLGSLTNTNGVAPATGSFAVQQDTGSDMAISISGTGNTTSGYSTAYVTVTPASQDAQVLRARMSSNYTDYVINANSTGSTVYDWIYLQANATNANVPDAGADNVINLYTSRSTSNASDNGSPPTYGILLAVVTVANGATAITNANIADKRTQVVFNTGGSTTTTGWQSVGSALTYSANNGSKEFAVTATGNLTGLLSPGMKMQVTRSVTPPTQCAAFTSASSQYATKSSPSGITFTSAFTCEAWVYLLSYTGQAQAIISRTDNSTEGFGLHINSSGQLTAFYIGSSSVTSNSTYQSVPLNQWVHVAGVYSSVSGKTLQGIYINGTAVPTFNNSNSATTLTQGGNLSVGAFGAGISNTYFNGYISEARIWSAAQTAANIQARMAINCAGTESNLVALYQFNGAWTDATSNTNTLTAEAGASNTQTSNPYNAIEYANVRAISYSNPTTTITLYTGDAGTIPDQTLDSPEYSTSREAYGLPEVLNSKILGQIIWAGSVTTTATATGTQLNGATLTMTIPSNGKKLVMKFSACEITSGAGTPVLDLYWGSTRLMNNNTTSSTSPNVVTAPFWATSGSQTFSVDMWETSAGTCTLAASPSYIAWFTVEEA